MSCDTLKRRHRVRHYIALPIIQIVNNSEVHLTLRTVKTIGNKNRGKERKLNVVKALLLAKTSSEILNRSKSHLHALMFLHKRKKSVRLVNRLLVVSAISLSCSTGG